MHRDQRAPTCCDTPLPLVYLWHPLLPLTNDRHKEASNSCAYSSWSSTAMHCKQNGHHVLNQGPMPKMLVCRKHRKHRKKLSQVCDAGFQCLLLSAYIPPRSLMLAFLCCSCRFTRTCLRCSMCKPDPGRPFSTSLRASRLCLYN